MKIKDNILQILSNGTTSGNKFFLQGTLDRKSYTDANKVLESAGGKWSKKEKAHVFEGDAFERLEQILATGETEVPKDDFDFFPTPSHLAERVAELAEIEPGMSVLEPSAGHGALAIPAIAKGGKVTGIEIAKANQAVLENIEGLELVRGDFLEMELEAKFDRIVMNPPFCRQSDIRHVNHARKFLKEGGKLVSIMGSSVLWRDNKLTKEFREFVEDHDGEFIELPANQFKEVGTSVGTVIVHFRA